MRPVCHTTNTLRHVAVPVVGRKEKVIYLTLYQCKALIMYPSFEGRRAPSCKKSRIGIKALSVHWASQFSLLL